MTRTISTAILALALGFSTPVLAQQTEVSPQIQDTLTQYGYDVDPSLLTDEQIEGFESLAVQGTGDNEGDEQMRRRIDQILVMDAGTSTFVSEEMRAMMDNPTELEANAENILSRAGMTDVDVSALSTEQLAQLWFLQEADAGDDTDLRQRVEEILGAS